MHTKTDHLNCTLTGEWEVGNFQLANWRLPWENRSMMLALTDRGMRSWLLVGTEPMDIIRFPWGLMDASDTLVERPGTQLESRAGKIWVLVEYRWRLKHRKGRNCPLHKCRTESWDSRHSVTKDMLIPLNPLWLNHIFQIPPGFRGYIFSVWLSSLLSVVVWNLVGCCLKSTLTGSPYSVAC